MARRGGVRPALRAERSRASHQLPDSGQLPDAGAVAAKFKTATMIAAGICEVVGLFGLVLVFLGDSLPTLYLFNVVAATAMMLHRPKMEELQRLAGKSGFSM